MSVCCGLPAGRLVQADAPTAVMWRAMGTTDGTDAAPSGLLCCWGSHLWEAWMASARLSSRFSPDSQAGRV
ncbi:hypothetical protein AOLI_G00221920 [Acnodon oligacanthus]